MIKEEKVFTEKENKLIKFHLVTAYPKKNHMGDVIIGGIDTKQFKKLSSSDKQAILNKIDSKPEYKKYLYEFITVTNKDSYPTCKEDYLKTCNEIRNLYKKSFKICAFSILGLTPIIYAIHHIAVNT